MPRHPILRPLFPQLPPRPRLRPVHDQVAAIEGGIEPGMVCPHVRPAALPSLERAHGDQAGERIRIVQPGVSGGGPSSALSAARLANTKHSLSEFEASRLAPCSPVHAVSPTA